jgi:hypothetical protein
LECSEEAAVDRTTAESTSLTRKNTAKISAARCAAEEWDADHITVSQSLTRKNTAKISAARCAAEEWDADPTQRRESTASASKQSYLVLNTGFETKINSKYIVYDTTTHFPKNKNKETQVQDAKKHQIQAL